ncbi:hypothetical protein GGQ54_001247 [Naumannella cuiyingiana]|uniref:Sap, sulfolipid-1-addressing protein n=1 Tax=Naumannella cuiyingiana TaxID=1347891 RepID=A0A7Z0IKQ2_9ACTN|nr:hypothetical protein [Naumannella cuiyingiana]
MDVFGLLGLAGLALVDSTSIGTLVVPIFLLLAANFRLGRVLVYLATIAIFYFAIGLALLFGARGFVENFGAALDSPPAYWVQLVLGIGLFALSWFINPGKENAERAKQGLAPKPSKWEQRLSGSTGTAAVMGVALLAGIAELAMMLPYLGAIGILTASGLPMAGRVAALAGYVAVMIAPALALIGVRLALGEGARARLARIRDWVARQAAASVPWVLGIIGFLLARDAAWRLGLLDMLGS